MVQASKVDHAGTATSSARVDAGRAAPTGNPAAEFTPLLRWPVKRESSRDRRLVCGGRFRAVIDWQPAPFF